tara:strand:+ start:4135 stop:4344 length:210 start_codon:yes stop_codon:yes gene_type:complete
MELVFTQTIKRVNGATWPKGYIADYPQSTWDGIAKSLGEPLDSFTRTVEEAASKGVASKAKSKPRKKAA